VRQTGTKAPAGQVWIVTRNLLQATHTALVHFLGRVIELPRNAKRAIVFVIDLVILQQSIWIAYSLRIGEWVLWDAAIWKLTLGAAALMIPIFTLGGVYNAIFRYAGAGMMRILLNAFVKYTAAMVAIFLLWGFQGVPRTMGLLQPLLFFLMIVAARLIGGALLVDLLGRSRFEGETERLLIFGAGRQGQQLAASMRSDPAMQLLGFIDDDVRLHGQRLDGHPIYSSANLAELVGRLEATGILLSIPNLRRRRRRDILAAVSELDVRVKTLPPMRDLDEGTVSITDIRELEIEDLLGREPVRPNDLLLGRTIVGKNVLVTGAGGSIGSELCRQIMRNGASVLVMFERSEFALYALDRELREEAARTGASGIELVPVLGSVTDSEHLFAVLQQHGIHTVYHAAAYKHVPLVEANPITAIRNNVFGTLATVEAVERSGVSDFILISTDKAVRPTNVMGATKRSAEQIVQAFAAKSASCRYSMVRFGNVLGSSGSVVPLFRDQIARGGPITLTDRRVTRYFMTIPEAANLVIQAGGLAKGGEVFVLDMGKPMKILDLARTMVRLSGLSVRDEQHPEGDIEIVEVGLRPGEKMYEELLIGEDAKPTAHKRIMMAHEEHLSWASARALLDQLRETSDSAAAIALLERMVPEFAHRRAGAGAPTLAEAGRSA
jgi:FlaA1/EpsC-like NDP-sugar epimerase